MTRTPDDERENIVDILIAWQAEALRSTGKTEAQAQEISRRTVTQLLGLVGGRKWYLPRTSVEADALGTRDEAIRQAQRRGTPKVIILRVFKVSEGHYYRILRHVSSGSKRKAG